MKNAISNLISTSTVRTDWGTLPHSRPARRGSLRRAMRTRASASPQFRFEADKISSECDLPHISQRRERDTDKPSPAPGVGFFKPINFVTLARETHALPPGGLLDLKFLRRLGDGRFCVLGLNGAEKLGLGLCDIDIPLCRWWRWFRLLRHIVAV